MMHIIVMSVNHHVSHKHISGDIIIAVFSCSFNQMSMMTNFLWFTRATNFPSYLPQSPP